MPPVFTNASSFAVIINVPFTFQLTASNQPTAFSVFTGTLPEGLELNSGTGLISGTYTGAAQDGEISFSASNAFGEDVINITFYIVGNVFGTEFGEEFLSPSN